ncbi:MAG: FAD-dependent oxidoreductase [Bacteroidia bacterium]|nr:FAD-dependent oxidoreductase [Bacteroidia bacterium]
MKSFDTIVVGGGFAGIAAARELYKSKQSFLVLEARDRLGGRVHSSKVLNGADIELGGQWIGPGQDLMYQLVEEFGIETYRTYDTGKAVLDLNQRIKTYSGLIPKVDPLSLYYIDRTIKRLDKFAATINLDAPWSHPKAHDWDSMTLESFLQKYVRTKKALKIMRAGMETVMACSTAEISLLHVLFYIKSGKDINTLLSIENGAQQDRIKGGMQSIIESMAKPFMDKIHFENPVRHIEQHDDGCIVHTPSGTFLARKVVVAIPPVLAGRIRFSPSLPIAKRQLFQKIPMGIVVKCYAFFDRPFWREKGFSGEVVTDENCPYQTIFDNGSPHAPYGVIMGFSLAQRASELMKFSKEERKQKMIEWLERYFGAEARNVMHYEDKCWADEEYSQGCYVGYFPPGVWTHYKDEIRKPSGHIHWAGAETATIWNGYIEGAVRSGIRAAQEILSTDG